MNKKNPVLKHAQKLGREEQKTIKGGIGTVNRRCCEWDDSGKCFIWTCDRCQCP
ncbi:hypothetical protein [Chryseobacterium sp. JUb7]|uniref:hypothetical protein n=1 Tax=Chryseobacterium sp. JUb7 TaxID=2940599 RepID=UPI002168E7B1|nr:hypothetical protein [Chryseobacterium sp. JUb7]MCS3530965.1 hypothetical protein [Chryseobacterium sp. JUb7]